MCTMNQMTYIMQKRRCFSIAWQKILGSFSLKNWISPPNEMQLLLLALKRTVITGLRISDAVGTKEILRFLQVLQFSLSPIPFNLEEACTSIYRRKNEVFQCLLKDLLNICEVVFLQSLQYKLNTGHQCGALKDFTGVSLTVAEQFTLAFTTLEYSNHVEHIPVKFLFYIFVQSVQERCRV